MTTSTSFAQMANNQSISLSSALRANTPPTKGQTTSRKFLTLSIFFRLLFAMFLTLTASTAWGADVTFTAGTDKGSTTNTSADSMEKSGITISSTSAGLAYDQYRFYNGTITISSIVGNISEIVFTCTSTNYASVLGGSTASVGSLSINSSTVTWTGSSSSFTIKNTAQTRVSKIVVTTVSSTLKVTYNANGATSGSVPTDATSYTSGATVTVKSNSGNLAKTGYTFGGWNTNSSGIGTNYTAGSGTFKITANTTLYAKWTVNTHTLTWNVNGGNDLTGTYTQGTVAYGTTITKPSNPTRTGHTFKGWSTDGTNVVTPASTMPDNDLTYIALWTPLAQHTITWNVDGSVTTEEVYEGSKPTNAPTIDPDNLPCNGADKFVGWTTGSYSGDTAPTILYPTASDIPTITGDVTFYAVFADYANYKAKGNK